MQLCLHHKNISVSSLNQRRQLPLGHVLLRPIHALDEEAVSSTDRVAEVNNVKNQRKKRAEKEERLPSPSDTSRSVVPPKKRGRPKKDKDEPTTGSPIKPLPLGTIVLPQAAAAVYSLIVQHEMTTLRELLVARNISHKTLLKHLLALAAFGLIQDDLMDEMHFLPPTDGQNLGLTRGQIDDVLKGKSIKSDEAYEILLSQYPEAVAAQEARHQGITMMQIEYVKSLVKRGVKTAKANDTITVDEDQQLTLMLLRKADLVRVQAYLEGVGVEDLRLPPYSRKSKREGGVSRISVLESLIEAAKAGVQLPLARVLNDFFLLPEPDHHVGGKGQGWLSVSEVCDAVGSCLHMRLSGLSGIIVYESSRKVLLRSEPTRSKVEEQETREEAMSQDLTIQQIRLCYYLGMAGAVKVGAEWHS